MTDPQISEPARKNSGREYTRNKLADCVMSKANPISGRHELEKEDLVIFNASKLRNIISSFPYLIENELGTMMARVPDNCKPHGDSQKAAMLQGMVGKTLSAKCESVNIQIRLQRTTEDISSSTLYLVKVTEVLLETNKVVKTAAHVVRREANRAVELSMKGEERIKRFTRATKKVASVRSLSSSESPAMNILYNRTSDKAYSNMDFDEEERCHTRESEK